METKLEYILVNFNKASMIGHIAAHPKDFYRLIELAISDNQPYSQKASWLLWSCMEENDIRSKGYINQIIDAILTKKDEQQRELFIILHKMELQEETEGTLFDICVNAWQNTHKMPSVRFNAFKLIVKIAKKYPELENEMEYLLREEYFESLSMGARKSILKMSSSLKSKTD